MLNFRGVSFLTAKRHFYLPSSAPNIRSFGLLLHPASAHAWQPQRGDKNRVSQGAARFQGVQVVKTNHMLEINRLITGETNILEIQGQKSESNPAYATFFWEGGHFCWGSFGPTTCKAHVSKRHPTRLKKAFLVVNDVKQIHLHEPIQQLFTCPPNPPQKHHPQKALPKVCLFFFPSFFLNDKKCGIKILGIIPEFLNLNCSSILGTKLNHHLGWPPGGNWSL